MSDVQELCFHFFQQHGRNVEYSDLSSRDRALLRAEVIRDDQDQAIDVFANIPPQALCDLLARIAEHPSVSDSYNAADAFELHEMIYDATDNRCVVTAAEAELDSARRKWVEQTQDRIDAHREAMA